MFCMNRPICKNKTEDVFVQIYRRTDLERMKIQYIHHPYVLLLVTHKYKLILQMHKRLSSMEARLIY